MDSSNSEILLCEASTYSLCNNSIHIDEYIENYFTMNRQSNLPISLNLKDYERSTNEGQDEEFQISKKSQFPLSLNPMDYESSSDEGQYEEFPINRESQFPLSPNHMDQTTIVMKTKMRNFQ